MPAKSQKQFRAMQAAKHGNSNLGIPVKVGAEFVAAGPPEAEGKAEPGDRPAEERGEPKQYHLRKKGRGFARANR